MATPAPPTTEELEEATTEEIAAAIAAAIATGLSGAALIAATDPVTRILTTATTTAVTQGAADFADALADVDIPAPPLATSRPGIAATAGSSPTSARATARSGPTASAEAAPQLPTETETRTIVRNLAIGSGIAYILTDAARILTRATTPDQRSERLAQTVRRLKRDAITKIHTARNEGAAHVARSVRIDIVWTTQGDRRVCPVCEAMNGVVIASEQRFPSGEVKWDGFSGMPPAHHFCRCRPLPASQA